MLEKDVARRIQSPAELRVELKRCIEELRGSASSARGNPSDRAYQTVGLSSSRGLSSQPKVGTLLKGRYRLIEDLNASEPGAAFHAEDEKLKQRVALRILNGDSAAFSLAGQETAQAQKAAHPNFVRTANGAKPPGFCMRKEPHSKSEADARRGCIHGVARHRRQKARATTRAKNPDRALQHPGPF